LEEREIEGSSERRKDFLSEEDGNVLKGDEKFEKEVIERSFRKRKV